MIDVVFPCLDEALALPSLLPRLPEGFRAIVADNGSTDGSADIARDYGATVVTVPQRGFGAAVHTGLEAAESAIVCVCDADGSLDPEELPRVTEPVEAGRADLVLGRRRPVERGAFPVQARIANAIIARGLRRRGCAALHDLGPMRAAWREELLALPLSDRRFGYPLEMVVEAMRAGWRIEETDVSYRNRAAGSKSKVTGNLRGSARAIRDMRAVWSR